MFKFIKVGVTNTMQFALPVLDPCVCTDGGFYTDSDDFKSIAYKIKHLN